jgi:predicted acetyltransferase
MAEADIPAAAAVQVDAFGGVVDDIIGRYHSGSRHTWRDAWVVERGGEISAVALSIPATWWFRGQSNPISAIAGVAVRPVDRRRRLAHDLMRAMLRADLEKGRPFSLLFPFQHGFYRRLGYGSVGLMYFWRLPLAHMRDEPELRARVRLCRADDRPRVEALFARSLREAPEGGLERRAGQWQWRWAQDEHWIVYDAGDISGYLVYRTEPGVLQVRELVALTAEAERGLWSFVAAQVEQRQSATFLAPLSKPLWATLREPYMFEGHRHGFIVNDVAELTISFMARGVDWAAALGPRAYPEGTSGRITLELADSVFGPRCLELEFDAGHAHIRASQASPTVRADVSAFSQLYCGALSAKILRWYGQLEADDAAIALLDAAFPPGPPFIAPFDWF